MRPVPTSVARRHRLGIAGLVVLACLTAGCSRASDPSAPVDAGGKPAAADAPERFYPTRVDGNRLRKVAPAFQAQLASRLGEYGLDGWVTSLVGGTVNAPEDDNNIAFVAVARTTGPDRAKLQNLAFLAGGTGEVINAKSTTIAGESVDTGTVLNKNDRIDFAIWQARPDLVVVATTGSYGRASGTQATGAMRQIIEWSRK